MQQKLLKGYRLHDARIAYSGGTGSIRSIKYELSGNNKNTIANAIIHDYHVMYGDLNLNDYMGITPSVSLIDFWLKAISLGFVFSNQNSIVREFKKYLNLPTPEDKIFHELSSSLQQVVDPDMFINFLFTRQRGLEKKSHESRQKIILNLAKKDGDNALLQKIAEQWATGYSTSIDLLEFKCGLFRLKVPNMVKSDYNLSFAVDPNFPIIETSDRTKLLDTIIHYYQDKSLDEKTIARFISIGDNGNYFNGLFNNLMGCLKSGNLDQLAQYLSATYELNNYQEIFNRLSVLKDMANHIDEPQLVSKWSDYRSDFNGTIESWYSNRRQKQNDTEKHLKVKQELLKAISATLPDSSPIKSGILQKTIGYIDQIGTKISRTHTDELHSYLSTLSSQLNEVSQQNPNIKSALDNIKLLDNAGKERKIHWQKELSKRVQASPVFFGENKIKLWDQLKNLKRLIKEELNQVILIHNSEYQDYQITTKQVDMLANLYNRIKKDGNKMVLERLRQIEQSLQVKFSERSNNKKFHLSGYERGKYQLLPIPNIITIRELVTLANLIDLYQLSMDTPQKDYFLRDTIQLSKIVVSAMMKGGQHERVINLIHSNLSGYASLISRTEFISRYTVQAINGNQNLLAHNDNGKYFYVFDQNKFPESDKQNLFVAIRGNNFQPQDFKKRSDIVALAVKSSRYQIQFLDWFFGKHKKKRSWLSAAGSFTIVETSHQIDWSQEHPKITQLGEPRLFVSQPFIINPPQKKEFEQKNIKNRYIGVDIGEYGLAWSLVLADNQKITELNHGFIADKQQQALKSAVNEARRNQARQTFTSPNTYIARIRDSLIGSYRNQLESLAMTNNARLCYEYEVSSFETGSSRISKVYDSIKRSSVVSMDDNSQIKQSWGKVKNIDFNWRALETTAAGTSQICSKCKRWANNNVVDKDIYKLTAYQDKLYKTTVDNKEVRLLTKKDTGDKVRGDKLKPLIYNAMRPNEDGLGMEIVKRQMDWNKISSDYGAKKSRGNMAIFICPYLDCHHIADADHQAAFNIAVRGYLKDTNPERVKKKDGQGLTANYLTIEQSKLEYEAIGL